MEQWTGSKLEKEYVKAVYCHPAYLTYTDRVHHAKYQPGWSTSWNPDCQEKYQNLRYADDTTLRPESKEEWKSLLMKVKEETEKAGLNLNIQKTKIMASGPIISLQIDGKQWKQWETLFSWAPKWLKMVTAAMKLKDTCSLEEKLWPTQTAY